MENLARPRRLRPNPRRTIRRNRHQTPHPGIHRRLPPGKTKLRPRTHRHRPLQLPAPGQRQYPPGQNRSPAHRSPGSSPTPPRHSHRPPIGHPPTSPIPQRSQFPTVHPNIRTIHRRALGQTPNPQSRPPQSQNHFRRFQPRGPPNPRTTGGKRPGRRPRSHRFRYQKPIRLPTRRNPGVRFHRPQHDIHRPPGGSHCRASRRHVGARRHHRPRIRPPLRHRRPQRPGLHPNRRPPNSRRLPGNRHHPRKNLGN